jgi:DNA polymerase V
MDRERCYIAIDLKSFYASVECIERGLDPLTARLVVADSTRTEKTICLAVSPTLKALGIPGRARLYEVFAKTKDFIIAPPRMQKYIDVSRHIFEIYTSFVSPVDIHVYSIDEVFIDATSYLKNYKMTGHELALKVVREVLKETGITATAGVGTNMYLAKVAMDIVAKRMEPDKDGVRIAELDEMSYRRELWDHTPLTDFWRVGPGYSRRLKNLGVHTMGELARYSLSGSDKLYKTFGVSAELLIDHAWGFESATISDIKSYKTENHSVSIGQVLARPYSFAEARTIVTEMADELALDLAWKQANTDQIVLTIVYDVSNMKNYTGRTTIDHYGRTIPAHAHGSTNLKAATMAGKTIIKKSLELFEKVVDPELLMKRIYLVANHVKSCSAQKSPKQLDIFTDYQKMAEENERDERRTKAILEIKSRYGKNAILKGVNFEKEATAIKRHGQIGGHKA